MHRLQYGYCACVQLVICRLSGRNTMLKKTVVLVKFLIIVAVHESMDGHGCFKILCKIHFLLVQNDFFHHITGFDPVDDVQALDHLTEAGMHPVEMGRMVAAVADEKLGSARVGPAVCHRHDAPVVVLLLSLGLAGNAVTRASGARTLGAATLYHKSR